MRNLMKPSYKNRSEAGKRLADTLQKIEFDTRPVVIAIPNGGVPVGVEIANNIDADLDAIIVRKLQVPGNTEAGFGALTSYGSLLLNERLVESIGLTESQIERVTEKTRRQISRRKEEYANLIGLIDFTARDVILVDDGVASGYTMMAAIESVKEHSPKSIIVAAPTASKRAADLIEKKVRKLVCPRVETGFIFAVANAYENWYDIPDSEVINILKRAG